MSRTSGARSTALRRSPAELADRHRLHDQGQLRGRRIAIPSRFAVDHLFARRILKEHGMTARDVTIVEMAPPEMPAALYANQVDAYATGEPFGAVAEVAGYARILSMIRDKWPNYVCRVLTGHQDLISPGSR